MLNVECSREEEMGGGIVVVGPFPRMVGLCTYLPLTQV